MKKNPKDREYLKHLHEHVHGIITEGYMDRYTEASEDLEAGINLREALQVVYQTEDEAKILRLMEVYGEQSTNKGRKGETVRHPDLGVLRHDGVEFVGKHQTKLYPSPVKVLVEPALIKDKAVSSLWKQFRKREPLLFQELESSIGRYYNRMRRQLAPNEEDMPALSKPSAIWKSLRKPTVFFRSNGRKVELGISWTPTWEEEHGLYVFLSPEGKIKRIGEL